MIANKIDMEDTRVVTSDMAIEFTKNFNVKYYEVSAKTGEGVEDIFQFACEEFIEFSQK